MRHKKIAVFILLSAAVLAAAIFAQRAGTSPSLAQFVPRGPLVYAEATNLKDLLVWWRDSEFRENWMQTSNYKEFENSRLYLKLQDRIGEWGAEGTYSFSLNNLVSLAGTHSALALYDIGNLKAVAISEVSLAEAQTTELWAAKANFTRKKLGAQNYYVEPNNGVLSFAYVRPYLVIATDETMLQQTIGLIQGDASIDALDSSEKWELCRKFNPPHSTFSLFLDQEELNNNHYFNKYWLQQNVDDLKPIQAAWIDFRVERQALTERRYFVQGGAAAAETESNADAYLQPFRSARYDFLTLRNHPDPEQTAERVIKMVNRFPQQFRESSYPPKYSAALERAAQAESKSLYAQQIDEPVLVAASEKLLKTDQDELIRKLLQAAKPLAAVQLSYPLWDEQALFVQFPQSLAVQFENFEALDQKQFLNALRDHYLTLASIQGSQIAWQNLGAGAFLLPALNPVCVKFQKPWVLVSNRQIDFEQVAALLPANPATPNSSYAEINWQNGRWKYSRLMRRLDYGTQSGEEDAPPMFFSDNIGSLLDALAPIQRSTLVRGDSEEIVRYELH